MISIINSYLLVMVSFRKNMFTKKVFTDVLLHTASRFSIVYRCEGEDVFRSLNKSIGPHAAALTKLVYVFRFYLLEGTMKTNK